MIDLHNNKTPDGDKPSNRAAEIVEQARKKEGEAPETPLGKTLLGDDESGGRAGQGGMGGPAS
jgi:hypothetical protein